MKAQLEAEAEAQNNKTVSFQALMLIHDEVMLIQTFNFPHDVFYERPQNNKGFQTHTKKQFWTFKNFTNFQLS